MSGVIPIEPGDPDQRIDVALGAATYHLRVRWNTRDNAGVGSWYLDIYEADAKTPIVTSVKLVIGVLLGRRSTHPLFNGNLFLVAESDLAREAGLFDLGARVTLWYLEPGDADLASMPDPVTPPVES